jgi:hypothetical protein
VFKNVTEGSVNGVYTFPVDSCASVNRLCITVGDRVILGSVMERVAATAKYEAALARGDAACLLEQSRGSVDMFKVCVLWGGGGGLTRLPCNWPCPLSPCPHPIHRHLLNA